jgi:N-acetylglutamate synthase-like GNAT family acetyltransferase
VKLGLRQATLRDKSALLAFLAEQGLPTDDVLSAGSVYWVAESGMKEVIASVGLESGVDVGLLRSVATDGRHRGEGLAKRLVQAALETARSRRLRRVYLFSTGAGGYFARLGFIECSVEELVIALPDAPQVIRFAALGWLSTEVAWRIDL